MPSLDSGILLSSRFETIIDKADAEIPKKHPQKLVACGVVSIYGFYIIGTQSKARLLDCPFSEFLFALSASA
jgi:hypothetical protein